MPVANSAYGVARPFEDHPALHVEGGERVAAIGPVDEMNVPGLAGIAHVDMRAEFAGGNSRDLGEEIGKGRPLSKILSETEMVVEGVETAKAVYKLSKKYKVPMPISRAVYDILFHGHDPKEAVRALMNRDSHRESD